MTERGAARPAKFVFALIAIGFALTAIAAAVNPPETVDWGAQGAFAELLFLTSMFAFPLVGVLVATRKPRNTIGWILLAVGAVWAADGVATVYARYAIEVWRGSLPRPDIAIAFSTALWVPGLGLIGTFLLMLFPDGRLPSARWKPFARFTAGVFALVWLLILVEPGNFGVIGYPDVENPLGLEILRGRLELVYGLIVLIPLCMLGSAAAVVVRFRRSRGVERLQLKWLACAGSVAALLALATILASIPFGVSGDDVPDWIGYAQSLSLSSFALIPAAIGVAILRHHLYDIDVIVNRTLVYGILTALLTGFYLIAITVLQAAFSPVTGESDLAVATSTLAVAALFRPIRRRVQGFIDRRFYRRKYDAARTMQAFSARLRNEVDIDALRADLIGVIDDVMRPSTISLWLRPPKST